MYRCSMVASMLRVACSRIQTDLRMLLVLNLGVLKGLVLDSILHAAQSSFARQVTIVATSADGCCAGLRFEPSALISHVQRDEGYLKTCSELLLSMKTFPLTDLYAPLIVIAVPFMLARRMRKSRRSFGSVLNDAGTVFIILFLRDPHLCENC